jgi:site-specific DNA-adenine methylase
VFEAFTLDNIVKNVYTAAMKNSLIKTYYGGKGGNGTYQTIINNIRPHKVFVSPFLGNDAVLRYKRPAQFSIGIDINEEITTLWKGVKIPNFKLITGDGLEFLKNESFEKETTIYLDPPYPKFSRRTQGDVYKFEFSNDQHEELLKVANNLSCDVLISTYENPIYSNLLKGWNLKKFKSTTRNGTAIEFLYMNFDNKEGLLHDYSYLGEDFIERQRIKRKINRWVNRLKVLPPLEKHAIIKQLLS